MILHPYLPKVASLPLRLASVMKWGVAALKFLIIRRQVPERAKVAGGPRSVDILDVLMAGRRMFTL
jgi:hypothetical protein